jgi:peptidoglycan/LPS O-acetylase OafA/YrhL
MFYTLAIILALLGAAACAILAIIMWGVGTPVLRRWRRRLWAKVRPPQLAELRRGRR